MFPGIPKRGSFQADGNATVTYRAVNPISETLQSVPEAAYQLGIEPRPPVAPLIPVPGTEYVHQEVYDGQFYWRLARVRLSGSALATDLILEKVEKSTQEIVLTIDLAAESVVASIRQVANPVNYIPSLSWQAGFVWVHYYGGGGVGLQKIDPTLNTVVASLWDNVIPFSLQPVVGGSFVWITFANIWRKYDVGTLSFISSGTFPGLIITGTAYCQGHVWHSLTATGVRKVNPATDATVTTVALNPAPQHLTADATHVWGTLATSLAKIDGASNALQSIACTPLLTPNAQDPSFLFVLHENLTSLIKVNKASNAVETINLTGLVEINAGYIVATGSQSSFRLGYEDSLVTVASLTGKNTQYSRVTQKEFINPSTNVVTTRMVGRPLAGGTLVRQALWVSDTATDRLLVWDINTQSWNGEIALPVGAAPSHQVFDGTYVWVSLFGLNQIAKINAATRTITSIINSTGTAPSALTVSSDSIWVVNETSDDLTRIDRVSGITSTVACLTAPRRILYDGYRVWVSYQANGTLSVIDPQTLSSIVLPNLGASLLRKMAFDGTDVWSSSTTQATAHRLLLNSSGLRTLNPTIVVGNAPSPNDDNFELVFDGRTMWLFKAEDHATNALSSRLYATRYDLKSGVVAGTTHPSLGDGIEFTRRISKALYDGTFIYLLSSSLEGGILVIPAG